MPTARKKPRIAHEEARSLVNSVLQGTRAEFDADLERISSAARLGAKLNALDEKLQEMSSWVMQHKVELQRKQRVQRKEQREEQLRAIYHRPERRQLRSMRNDNNNIFTAETVTTLLDSGFMSSEDIGRLFFLTGNGFFSNLHLDQRLVWRSTFEAKFSYEPNNGLSALYQSNKFNQLLRHKGYEWMFRQFFAKTALLPPNNESERELPIRADVEGRPASTLNSQNTFFIAMFQREANGQAFHAAVLDNEATVTDLLQGGGSGNQVDVPIPHDKMGLLAEILDNEEEPVFTVFALRMDTNECTTIHVSRAPFYYDGHAAYSDDADYYKMPLNNIGKELVKGLLPEESLTDESLDIRVTLSFWRDHSFCIMFTAYAIAAQGWDTHETAREERMNLYEVLDYGIDWT